MDTLSGEKCDYCCTPRSDEIQGHMMDKRSVVCGLFKEFAQLNIPRAACTTACSHENHSTTLLYIQERNAAVHIIRRHISERTNSS